MDSKARRRLVLLTFAVTIGNASCNDTTGPKPGASGPLTLSSHLDSLFAVGDSVQLTINSSIDNVIWQSRTAEVVQVTQTGRVTSSGPGDAWVVAFREQGPSDSAHMVVRQHVASLSVTPGSMSRPLQRTLRFQAVARDARGVSVPNATVAWSATGAATIDNSGLATATSVGTATISATANGVSATAQLAVTPLPGLRFSVDTVDVGVGQHADAESPLLRVVADSISADESFNAQLVVGDSSIAVVSPTPLQVPEYAGLHSSPGFQVIGRTAGATTLSASAAQYTNGSAVVRVSTPKIRIMGPNEWSAGDFTNTFGLAPTDSLGIAHTVVQPLAIHVRSTTAGVVAPEDTVVTMPAGQGYIQLPLRRANTGQTWLVASAPGYRTDSARLSVTPPKLRFIAPDYTNRSVATVGAGQTYSLFVYSSGSLPTDLPITLSQKHPEILRAPSSLLQPAEDFYGKVLLQTAGLRVGADTLIASAPGFLPDTLVVFVTTPAYYIAAYPASTTVGATFPLNASMVDSLGIPNPPTSAPGKALVVSSNPAVLRPATDTMFFGGDFGAGGMTIYVVGPGTATLTIRDPLGRALPATTAPIVVAPAQLLVTSDDPSISTARTVGMHQLLDAFVQIRTGGTVPDSIHLRSTDPTIARPSASAVTVGSSFLVAGGERPGTAWIVATAPGLLSDSMPVSVAAPSALIFASQGFGLTGQSAQCTLTLVDQAGNARPTAETVTFRIVSSDPSVITADSVLTVQAGQYQSNVGTLQFKGAGNAVLRTIDNRTAPYAYEPGASGVITVYAQQSNSRSP